MKGLEWLGRCVQSLCSVLISGQELGMVEQVFPVQGVESLCQVKSLEWLSKYLQSRVFNLYFRSSVWNG